MSDRSVTLMVDAALPGDRLDAWLKVRFPDVTRGTIQRLMDEGHIRVDGRPVKPSHHPKPGETITIEWPPPKALDTPAQEIPLEILHEDRDLLVINKAPDLVVHPAAGHEDGTLVNALLHHCRGELSGIGGVARPGIVHRLDKDTSGCLVVAKNDPTHVALAEQFAGREVQKIYHAIVCGIIQRDGGDIRAAIARHPSHRKRMAVSEGEGRDAWTSYRVLERLRHATWIEARLHTGRTHQIRVHFQHLGHPLVGDDTYGRRQNARLHELTGFTARRQMLHAWQIAFRHPRTGLAVVFEAPIPADFEHALNTLRDPPAGAAAPSARPR